MLGKFNTITSYLSHKTPLTLFAKCEKHIYFGFSENAKKKKNKKKGIKIYD